MIVCPSKPRPRRHKTASIIAASELEERAGPEVHAEDTRNPVRVERHDPVERCIAGRPAQNDQTQGTRRPHATDQRGVASPVLAPRLSSQNRCQQSPANEVNGGPEC